MSQVEPIDVEDAEVPPMEVPTEPCCPVALRPDAAAIDAALRAGRSIRRVAAEFRSDERPLSDAAVQRHRPHALGESEPTDAVPDSPRITADAVYQRGVGSPFAVPNPRDDAATSPRKVITAAIERRCIELRSKGRSYDDISAEVGVPEDTAIDIVERVLIRTRKGTDAKADSARQLDLARIDKLLAGLWDRATDPSKSTEDMFTPEGEAIPVYSQGQDRAVDRVTKLLERRAKLLGLDAPTGPTTQINILNQMVQSSEFREILEAILSGLEQYPGARETAMERVRGVLARRAK